MAPPDNVIKDNLAVNADVDDDWDLRYILPSGGIDVRSILPNNLSIIQKKCHLFGFEDPFNREGVFRTALQGLNTVGDHGEEMERLAHAQASVQEFELEVKCLRKANTVATSSLEVVTRLEGSSLMLGRRASTS